MTFALDAAGIERACRVLAARAPALAEVMRQTGPPPVRRLAPGFTSLARLVVGQQVSVAAAAGIWARLETRLGAVTPEALAAADDAALRAAGLSRAKVRYLRALAAAVRDRTLDLARIAAADDVTASATLRQVPGIGAWTAELYLIFALGRPDLWPAGDLAARTALNRMLTGPGPRPTPRQSAIQAAPFAPHRSALALLSWHVYTANPF